MAAAAAALGGSFTSVTSILTSTVSDSFELSLALTVTVCAGPVSWSRVSRVLTRIWPLLPSIVKRSGTGVSNSYLTVLPGSGSVAVTGLPTRAFAPAFSATLRVGFVSVNAGGLLSVGAAWTDLADRATKLSFDPNPSVYVAVTRSQEPTSPVAGV